MKQFKTKNLLSMLLCIVMLLYMLPGVAFASRIDTRTITEGTNNVTVNTYTSNQEILNTASEFGLTAEFSGRPNDEWVDTDSFEFTLTGDDSAPMPENTTATVTGQNGAIDFGTISYTQADLGGAASKDFTYHVQETVGYIDGITYDDHTATLTVNIKDNGKGGIVVSTSSKAQI